MFSLSNFTECNGQPIENKALLCWTKASGYFFLTYTGYLLAMAESNAFKIIAIEE